MFDYIVTGFGWCRGKLHLGFFKCNLPEVVGGVDVMWGVDGEITDKITLDYGCKNASVTRLRR